MGWRESLKQTAEMAGAVNVVWFPGPATVLVAPGLTSISHSKSAWFQGSDVERLSQLRPRAGLVFSEPALGLGQRSPMATDGTDLEAQVEFSHEAYGAHLNATPRYTSMAVEGKC